MMSKYLSRILHLTLAMGCATLLALSATTRAEGEGVSISNSSTNLYRHNPGDRRRGRQWGNTEGTIWAPIVSARLFNKAGNLVGSSQAPALLSRT